MPLSLPDARKELQAMIWAEWQARSQALLGYVAEVRWQKREASAPADQTKPWLRVSITHTAGEQATLAEPGARRFTHRGLVLIQAFSPTVLGEAYSDQVAQAALACIQGKGTPDVWIRNASARESSPEEPWFLWLVSGSFEYDEVA